MSFGKIQSFRLNKNPSITNESRGCPNGARSSGRDRWWVFLRYSLDLHDILFRHKWHWLLSIRPLCQGCLLNVKCTCNIEFFSTCYFTLISLISLISVNVFSQFFDFNILQIWIFYISVKDWSVLSTKVVLN